MTSERKTEMKRPESVSTNPSPNDGKRRAWPLLFLSNVFTIGCCAVVALSAAGCGEKYSSEGKALSVAVSEMLVKRGHCVNFDECKTKVHMIGEHGDRVRLKFYGLREPPIRNDIATFVINSGIGITNGTPIVLTFYAKSKEQYMGIMGSASDPNIRIEVNPE